MDLLSPMSFLLGLMPNYSLHKACHQDMWPLATFHTTFSWKALYLKGCLTVLCSCADCAAAAAGSAAPCAKAGLAEALQDPNNSNVTDSLEPEADTFCIANGADRYSGATCHLTAVKNV